MYATTSYDLLDRPATVGDGKATQTFTYDTAIDPRGLVTTVADSAAGTFTARYDPDGNRTVEGYPGGLEARTTSDQAGNQTELAYVKTSNRTADCTWLDFHADPSVHGQTMAQASTLSEQSSTYDNAARLAEADDTPAGQGCTIRAYADDPDTNRTSLTTNPPAPDGTCNASDPGTTTSHTYDPADRLTDPGFAYDPLGRITTVPAAATGSPGDVTAAYYATDMVQSLTQAGTTHTWTMDPAGRPRTRTDSGGATATRTNHDADDTDAPAWIAETADASHWTRNIAAIGTDLAAIQDATAGTTLQLANLHGDIVATASPDPTAPALLSTFEATEFGTPAPAPAPATAGSANTSAKPTTSPASRSWASASTFRRWAGSSRSTPSPAAPPTTTTTQAKTASKPMTSTDGAFYVGVAGRAAARVDCAYAGSPAGPRDRWQPPGSRSGAGRACRPG